MRISNNSMIYNFLSSLGKSQERMNKFQEQLSDGKIVHRPSDDPVRAIRSLRLNTDIATNEQYTQNVKDAQSWMNQSDSSLSDLSEIYQRAKEIVIDATSPNPSVAYKTAAAELDGLINHAISLANAQNGDRYIFAGQQDKIDGGPFTRTIINGTEYVVYEGDNNKISMRAQPGAANPAQDSVNVTGEEIFGPLTTVDGQATSDIFSNLLRIKEQLDTGAPSMTFLSGTAIQNIDDAHDRALFAQTQIGTRMASYEMAGNLLSNDYVTISENVSANDDLDIARATIDFKNNENVYQAALAVGAKIIPPSLVDFLS